MKTLPKLLLPLCFASPLHAGYFEDNYLFGASYIHQFAELKAERGRASETGNGFAVYLDTYIKHQYRIKSTFGYIHYDGFDVSELVFSADYLFPIKDSFSAFAGVGVGVASQKYKDAALGNAASDSVYGTQVGVIKYIDNSHLLELGIRQRNTGIQTVVDSIPVSTVSLKSLNEVYLSVLFMF